MYMSEIDIISIRAEIAQHLDLIRQNNVFIVL